MSRAVAGFRNGGRPYGMSALLVGLAHVLSLSAAAPDLATVLARMDTAAAGWRAMRAQFEWVRYMALVDDLSVESGQIAVRRGADGSATMLVSFAEPNEYFLALKEARVEIYKPNIKTVEEYDLSDSRAKMENALLLGFGTSGSYLDRHYEIGLVGTATVDDRPVVHLDLQPREPQAEVNNQHIEMWVSTELWQPVQQKIHELSTGDYRLFSYSEIELNPPLTEADFRLRLARGTKRVRPQR